MVLRVANALVVGVSVLVVAAVASSGGSRQVVSLDGEWQFALLASDTSGDGDSVCQDGRDSGCGTVLQSGTIQVPGAWEAQGYGNETATMWTQVMTGQNTGVVGVYTKRLALSPCQAPGAQHVFMIDQGIHRHAIFKIGGKVVGEHTGYMTPFEHVLDPSTTKDCCCGSSCEVEIRLDGNRACDAGGCSDALMGCMDDDIDPQGPGPWAGLNGHVTIECRPARYIDGGVGNIMPPHVTHPPVTTENSGKPLTVSVAFLISGGEAPASVQILENNTGTPVSVATSTPLIKPVAGNVTINVTIPEVKLWSPENRSLYVAVVTLGPTSAPLDQATTRFGVRTVSVSDGYKLMLNGHRLFLAGYGDDAIYPRTIAAPREQSFYAEKVQFTHEHGFNFVRHHSHTLPPEYFDACDEWGIFVSPELPCAYANFFKAGNATAQELYLASWTSYIGSYRNHPSVLTWTLCNEMKMPDTFKLPGSNQTFGSQVFYDVKQALDPSRLMNDQDGACTAADARASLSFCSHQFDVAQLGCIGYNQSGSCLGGDMPTKYHDTCDTSNSHACSFKTTPTLPLISHETGNYNSFPRIQSLIEFFSASGAPVRPYWLTPAQSKLNSSGLLAEVDAWATASEQLYVMCWKLDVEDQRRNAMISGYEWWLVTDYWTGNNGITDVFFRPKPGVANYITQFNARSIFLESGLELVYVSNDTLSVDLSLSNFGEGPLAVGSRITWSVLLDGISIKTATVATKEVVPQGELGVVASITYQLPDVGTSASMPFNGAVVGPKQITVAVEFEASSVSRPAPKNSWNATLLPQWVSVMSPTKQPIQVIDHSLQKSCGFSDCEVSSGVVAGVNDNVYLTTEITDELVTSVQAGSVVVLVQRASSSRFFKSERTNFKQAWWVGNAVDNNAGTLVYDNAAPVLGGMAPDGFGGQSWFRMIDGAQTFLLDEQWPNMPGKWTLNRKGTYGISDGCHDDVVGGCPASFPYPVNPKTGGTCGPSCKGVVCYKDIAEAQAGEGPCGSWCTKNVKIGKGCGNGHLCPPSNALSCPKQFLFPTQELGVAHGKFCYNNASEAAQGTGPCGSWCTFDPSSPRAVGCGDPKTHVCPAPTPSPSDRNHTSCKPAANITECQRRCDKAIGCNAVNFNMSHGCCLEMCAANVSTTPPTADGCCGSAREIGSPMPRDGVTVMMRAIDIVTLSRNKALLWSMPLGKGRIVATGLNLLGRHPEQKWVLDRLLRYAASLLQTPLP